MYGFFIRTMQYTTTNELIQPIIYFSKLFVDFNKVLTYNVVPSYCTYNQFYVTHTSRQSTDTGM